VYRTARGGGTHTRHVNTPPPPVAVQWVYHIGQMPTAQPIPSVGTVQGGACAHLVRRHQCAEVGRPCIRTPPCEIPLRMIHTQAYIQGGLCALAVYRTPPVVT
jgi:hypothetical protein